ncbi:uncharacterized protein LOC110092070 [Dendrobium catenatum]|nr:uncharacterized protein LOC110092070 [Dendrobium catenatum]
MAMNLLKNSGFSYSRLEKKDTEEFQHRKVQFRIYKVLEKEECQQRKRTQTRLVVSKLRTKLGMRLRRMRKKILCFILCLRLCKSSSCGNSDSKARCIN